MAQFESDVSCESCVNVLGCDFIRMPAPDSSRICICGNTENTPQYFNEKDEFVKQAFAEDFYGLGGWLPDQPLWTPVSTMVADSSECIANENGFVINFLPDEVDVCLECNAAPECSFCKTNSIDPPYSYCVCGDEAPEFLGSPCGDFHGRKNGGGFNLRVENELDELNCHLGTNWGGVLVILLSLAFIFFVIGFRYYLIKAAQSQAKNPIRKALGDVSSFALVFSLIFGSAFALFFEPAENQFNVMDQADEVFIVFEQIPLGFMILMLVLFPLLSFLGLYCYLKRKSFKLAVDVDENQTEDFQVEQSYFELRVLEFVDYLSDIVTAFLAFPAFPAFWQFLIVFSIFSTGVLQYLLFRQHKVLLEKGTSASFEDKTEELSLLLILTGVEDFIMMPTAVAYLMGATFIMPFNPRYDETSKLFFDGAGGAESNPAIAAEMFVVILSILISLYMLSRNIYRIRKHLKKGSFFTESNKIQATET